MNELFNLVLSLSVSGSIVAIIIFIIKFFVKDKFTKSWQYYIWLILILRMTIPFTTELNLVGSIFEKPEIKQSIADNNNLKNLNELIAYNLDSNELKSQSNNIDPQLSTNIKTVDYFKLLSSNLWIIWILGFIVILSIKITDYRGFIKYIKAERTPVVEDEILEIFDDVFIELKLKTNIDLYKSKTLKSPMLIGLFKPFIIIPEENNNINLRYIFIHELTHFKRLDIIFKWIIQILLCFHWFNPILYFVNRDINKLCELSCDELVIKYLDSYERQVYGNILISIAETCITYGNNVVSTTLYQDKRILKERLNFIMNFKNISKSALCVSTALIAVISSMSVIVGAATLNNNKTKVSNNTAALNAEIQLNNELSDKTNEVLNDTSNEFIPINKSSDKPNYNEIYNNDKLIAYEDISYMTSFGMYISGKSNSKDESGIHAERVYIKGTYTIFDINLKSDFELTLKYDIINNSNDFKVVFITPDNKVNLIAQSGNGEQKLQLLKGRNRIKLVGRNDSDSTASIDFKFNIKELNSLLAKCVDFESIVALKGYCDDDIATKFLSDYIDNHDINLDDLEQIAPYLDADTLDKCIRKILDQENTIDLDKIKSLAPYMNESTINLCIDKASQAKNSNVIRALAPYASKESINTFIEKNANNIDSSTIKSLAPYASKEGIDIFIKNAANNDNIDSSTIKSLASYASKEGIDIFIKNAANNDNIDSSTIKSLASYASKEGIDTFIKNAANNDNIDSSTIRSLASYASKEGIDTFIKNAVNNDNIDSSTIRSLASYASKEGISYFIVNYAHKQEIDFNLVKSLAPYANQTSIDSFIEAVLSSKKATYKNIKPLLSYAGSNIIDNYIENLLDN